MSAKEVPGDFDACWDTEGMDFNRLQDQDPVLLTFDSRRAAQKSKYGGELFLAQVQAEARAPYRIFLDFFQTDKDTGNRKGIVLINLQEWPL